jgi:hypothetical protein
VTFTLYSDASCLASSGISGSGTASTTNGVSTATFSRTGTPAAAGVYHWLASYAGDTNNNSASSACADAGEQLMVVYNVVGFAAGKTNYKAGSAISGGFQLADAGGTPISSTQAQTVASNCWAKVKLDNGTPVCATYTKKQQKFSFSVATTKSTTKGPHTITLQVYAGSTLLNTKTAAVSITSHRPRHFELSLGGKGVESHALHTE